MVYGNYRVSEEEYTSQLYWFPDGGLGRESIVFLRQVHKPPVEGERVASEWIQVGGFVR